MGTTETAIVSSNASLAPQGPQGITRDNYAGTEIERSGETISTALAERERAAIESRFQIAYRRPRDVMQVRQRMLAACQRPGFAASSRYARPVGKQKNEQNGQWEDKLAEGWSIRAAEEFARNMTNILIETDVVYDDREKRLMEVRVTDLEANLTIPTKIMIEKYVESKSPRDGDVVISQRTNSYGKITYRIEATEDRLMVKQAALVSKAMRTSILRLVPGDLLEEALAAVLATEDGNGKDTSLVRKSLVDGFARIGITAAHLGEYLGHGVDMATAEQLAHLRGIGVAIKEGETTWKDVMATVLKGDGDAAPASDAAEKLKEKLAAAKAKKAAEKPPETAPAPASSSTEPATGKITAPAETSEKRATAPVTAPAEKPAEKAQTAAEKREQQFVDEEDSYMADLLRNAKDAVEVEAHGTTLVNMKPRIGIKRYAPLLDLYREAKARFSSK